MESYLLFCEYGKQAKKVLIGLRSLEKCASNNSSFELEQISQFPMQVKVINTRENSLFCMKKRAKLLVGLVSHENRNKPKGFHLYRAVSWAQVMGR